MRGKLETAAYIDGMARVFSMKGENARQEACQRAAEIVRKGTDKQSVLYSLRTASEYQHMYGSIFAAAAYDECIQAVYTYTK